MSSRPDPAVAAVRVAVRRALAELPPGAMVLAACSGGADSLALAAALAFEAPRSGRPAGGITIDHGLQEGSARRADQVVRTMRELGLDPVGSVAVTVEGPGGPEAAARRARYAALDEAATRLAGTVFLGHTFDDQAETVLLGLARGSGARSLAGMSPAAGRYRRPLLDLTRATTRRACQAIGLQPWDDPHNDDPAYARVRVRTEALPALEKALGPGVPEALARTARMLREAADALDTWADQAHTAAQAAADRTTPDRTAPNRAAADRAAADRTAPNRAAADRAAAERAAPDRTAADRAAPNPAAADRAAESAVESAGGGGLDVRTLAGLPRAVRTRVLRRAAIEAGSPAGALAAVHIDEVDRLVTAWHGQRQVDLPGGVRAVRRYGKLLFGTA